MISLLENIIWIVLFLITLNTNEKLFSFDKNVKSNAMKNYRSCCRKIILLSFSYHLVCQILVREKNTDGLATYTKSDFVYSLQSAKNGFTNVSTIWNDDFLQFLH